MKSNERDLSLPVFCKRARKGLREENATVFSPIFLTDLFLVEVKLDGFDQHVVPLVVVVRSAVPPRILGDFVFYFTLIITPPKLNAEISLLEHGLEVLQEVEKQLEEDWDGHGDHHINDNVPYMQGKRVGLFYVF